MDTSERRVSLRRKSLDSFPKSIPSHAHDAAGRQKELIMKLIGIGTLILSKGTH